jgi:hypothetical protein
MEPPMYARLFLLLAGLSGAGSLGACPLSIFPSSADVDAASARVIFKVGDPSVCGWSAASDSGWVIVEIGGSPTRSNGFGDGNVQILVHANGAAARTAHITVTSLGGAAAAVFTVRQSAATPAAVPSGPSAPGTGPTPAAPSPPAPSTPAPSPPPSPPAIPGPDPAPSPASDPPRSAPAPANSGPAIHSHGIVDAAGFRQVASRGGITSIFGGNLAASTVIAGVVPLPTVLDGVRVLVNGQAAPPFFVSPSQINFQASTALPPSGFAEVVVEREGLRGAPAKMLLAPDAPGISPTKPHPVFACPSRCGPAVRS